MKRILIPGWSLGDNAWGVTKPYLHYFSQFGQVEILTPRQGVESGDLLVLPGGQDTNPANYNTVPSFYTGNNDTFKEYFFRNNLPQYIESGTPIFGVCLGMQMLNVHFGGTLTQHQDYPYSSRDRTELVEKLEINSNWLNSFGLHPKEKRFTDYKVNSLHHQGVHEEQLGKDLLMVAKSTSSSNVEILTHRSLPIYGVQYHPEETHDLLSNFIINKLLKL